MKLTEAEAIIKLERVGLPVHGTYDELIKRLKDNGLYEEAKDIHNAAIAQGGTKVIENEAKALTSGPDNGFDESHTPQEVRRGRPKMGVR